MHRSRSSILGLLAAILVTATPAAALEPNACIAGKIACTNAFASAVFKCYAKIVKLGKIKTLCDALGNTATALDKAKLFVAFVVVGLEP